jgi:hypothetical protein
MVNAGSTAARARQGEIHGRFAFGRFTKEAIAQREYYREILRQAKEAFP